MINTTSEQLKASNFYICQYFSFYEQLKLRAQLSIKKFINLGPGCFTLIVFLLSYWFPCPVSFLRGAVGCSVMRECAISKGHVSMTKKYHNDRQPRGRDTELY